MLHEFMCRLFQFSRCGCLRKSLLADRVQVGTEKMTPELRRTWYRIIGEYG